ncbi:integrase [Bartonella massiliensis]|uniref:integrase n=1 Tax=Bartonella massiliensis TaxID=929795 RepID=UPI001158B7E0|nr:integrase [Bartonella massiliensis]
MEKYIQQAGLKACPRDFFSRLHGIGSLKKNNTPYEIAETILRHMAKRQIERTYRHPDD